MHTRETRHMKPPHSIFPFFAAGVCYAVLAISCLTTPAAAQTADGPAGGNAVAVINDRLNSNEGGTMVSLTNQITGDALNKSAIGLHDAAWKANKMGASSSTIGGLLERRDNLKNASSKLSIGGVFIDHVGYGSTAAGEIVGGRYMQGFMTIADGAIPPASTLGLLVSGIKLTGTGTVKLSLVSDDFATTYDSREVPIPEPLTIVLLGLGGLLLRRRS